MSDWRTSKDGSLPVMLSKQAFGFSETLLRNLVVMVLLLAVAGLGVGCSSDLKDLSFNFEDNDGSTLTTTPGDPVKPEWLKGKWDVDGELTNTANGNPGISSIPENIDEDIFGTGWKFEDGGVLKVDTVGGFDLAHYRLDGCTLTVKLPDREEESVYQAHFQFGYLYLKDKNGNWTVFEKDKFFGF